MHTLPRVNEILVRQNDASTVLFNEPSGVLKIAQGYVGT